MEHFSGAQLTQIGKILTRHGVSTQSLQYALRRGVLDDVAEAIGTDRIAKLDDSQRTAWRRAFGLEPKPKGRWEEISYDAYELQRSGFALMRSRRPVRKQADVYRFWPRDFGLGSDATPDQVIRRGIELGFEYCPRTAIDALLKKKQRSSTPGYIVAPSDEHVRSTLLVWDQGKIDLAESVYPTTVTGSKRWSVLLLRHRSG